MTSMAQDKKIVSVLWRHTHRGKPKVIPCSYNMTLHDEGGGEMKAAHVVLRVFSSSQLAVCNEHAICHALQAMCGEKNKTNGEGDRGGHCPARGSAPGELWKWLQLISHSRGLLCFIDLLRNAYGRLKTRCEISNTGWLTLTKVGTLKSIYENLTLYTFVWGIRSYNNYYNNLALRPAVWGCLTTNKEARLLRAIFLVQPRRKHEFYFDKNHPVSQNNSLTNNLAN